MRWLLGLCFGASLNDAQGAGEGWGKGRFVTLRMEVAPRSCEGETCLARVLRAGSRLFPQRWAPARCGASELPQRRGEAV